MKILYNIFLVLVLVILFSALLSNILIEIQEGKISIFSLRNLFVIFFILILLKNNRITTIALISMIILFWINYLFFNSNSSYFSNQVIYYTDNIYYLFFQKNKLLHKIILNLPLISNVFILIFIIPYRFKSRLL